MLQKIKKKNMPSEESIVKAVERFIIRTWKVDFKREVPFCERNLDVFLKLKNGSYVAIEAKVDAAARAFKQAARYRYLADYVYVAIFKNKSNNKSKSLSKQTGIGLILVNEDSLGRLYAKCVIKSGKFKLINRHIAKETYNTYFKKRYK